MLPLLTVLLLTPTSETPALDGRTLLARTIAHHDPSGDWMKSTFDFEVRGEYADGRTNLRKVRINYATGRYHGRHRSNGHEIEMVVEGDRCTLRVDGRTDIPSKLAQKLRISCERAKMFRNYMSYLWGLPMKLNDPGTLIERQVRSDAFDGKPVLVLTVRYKPAVGTDTWSFYIDPKTYAMVGYAFEKADGKGEYITLSGRRLLSNGARIPATRSWYVTQDRRFLGRDVLVSAQRVEP